MSTIKSDIKLVTPEVAQQMLCHNRDNREIRDSVVERYVKLLKSGQWKVTHQGIGFDTDGRLVDGQHRLSAIVRSGVPAEVMVTTGLDPESFKVLDQGVKRTAADVLRVPKRMAEVINYAARVYTHEMSPSPEVLDKMYRAIGPQVEALLEGRSQTTAFFSSSPMKLAAVARVLMGENPAYVYDLYADLTNSTVESLPPVGAALMRNYLQKRVPKGKLETMAVGLYVFHQKNKDSKQVRPDVDSAGAFVRAALSKVYDK